LCRSRLQHGSRITESKHRVATHGGVIVVVRVELRMTGVPELLQAAADIASSRRETGKAVNPQLAISEQHRRTQIVALLKDGLGVLDNGASVRLLPGNYVASSLAILARLGSQQQIREYLFVFEVAPAGGGFIKDVERYGQSPFS